MIISGEALAEGTIAGVAAAVVLSLWSEGSNFLKNALLSRRVRRSVSNFGVGDGIRGISVTVHNATATQISIREGVLLSDTSNFVLNPENGVKSIWDDNEVSFDGKMESVISSPTSSSMAINAFPDIPPFSSRTFLLDAKLATIPFTPKGIRFIIEHRAEPNGSRIIKVASTEGVNKLLTFAVAHFKAEFETGNLNKVRVQFGLPPIQKIPIAK
jgi:hypothetical protein